MQAVDDRAHIATGAIHIVDDEKRVVSIQVFEQVLQAVCAHPASLLEFQQVIIAASIRSTHRDVIGFDTEILQTLLYVNPDRGPTAPYPDDKIGAKSAAINLHREAIGILE